MFGDECPSTCCAVLTGSHISLESSRHRPAKNSPTGPRQFALSQNRMQDPRLNRTRAGVELSFLETIKIDVTIKEIYLDLF